jgi:hypothetical protein
MLREGLLRSLRVVVYRGWKYACEQPNELLYQRESAGPERRRELRSRCEALRTGLYSFAASPLFLELSDHVNLLARLSYDIVNLSTRDYRPDAYIFNKARFDEALKTWRYLRAKLSLEELLREPVWGTSREIHIVEEKLIREMIDRDNAKARAALEKLKAERGKEHNAQ